MGCPNAGELLARDFSVLSPAVKVRSDRLVALTADGGEVSERWTFYPNGQPVTVRVLATATFGSNTVIHEPATHPPFDNQHKYTILFPEDHEYIVELTLEVEGREEVIPFLVVAGEPTATLSVVIAIVAGLALFLLTVRAI